MSELELGEKFSASLMMMFENYYLLFIINCHFFATSQCYLLVS